MTWKRLEELLETYDYRTHIVTRHDSLLTLYSYNLRYIYFYIKSHMNAELRDSIPGSSPARKAVFLAQYWQRDPDTQVYA